MGIDIGQRRTGTSETRDGVPLRRGWTTGACATAATKAALTALLTGDFPDPVEIALPKGERPAFPLARTELNETTAFAAIVKDAGDDRTSRISPKWARGCASGRRVPASCSAPGRASAP